MTIVHQILSPGLAAFWNGLTDVGPNALHLTNANGATGADGPSAKIPNALDFDPALSQYLTRSDSPAFAIGSPGFTAAIVLNLDALNTLYRLMGQLNTSGTNRSWLISKIGNSTFELLLSSTGTSTGQLNLLSNTFGNPSVDQWCWIVVKWDDVANEAAITVNGSVNKDTAAFADAPFNTTVNFTIGTLANLTQFINGQIAYGAGLWHEVKSDAWIDWFYNNGIGRAYGDVLLSGNVGMDCGGAASIAESSSIFVDGTLGIELQGNLEYKRTEYDAGTYDDATVPYDGVAVTQSFTTLDGNILLDFTADSIIEEIFPLVGAGALDLDLSASLLIEERQFIFLDANLGIELTALEEIEQTEIGFYASDIAIGLEGARRLPYAAGIRLILYP